MSRKRKCDINLKITCLTSVLYIVTYLHYTSYLVVMRTQKVDKYTSRTLQKCKLTDLDPFTIILPKMQETVRRIRSKHCDVNH